MAAAVADLGEYERMVRRLRELAKERGISESVVRRAFEETFAKLERRHPRRVVRSRSRVLSLLPFLFLGLAFACAVSCPRFDGRSVRSAILRNLQSSIYPGLRLLRRLGVPVLERYPSLSELYDEWCLLENPYFHVSEIDCWPCTLVRSVPDLTGRNLSGELNPGIPYTRAEQGTTIRPRDLYDLYWQHADVFDRDAGRVTSSDPRVRRIREAVAALSENGLGGDSGTLSQGGHVSWRINRLEPGRIVRRLFPRPGGSPDWWEQSIEKFVLLDEPGSPAYSLPSPECSNAVIRCAVGARLIKMTPSPECSHSCQPSTILLSSGKTLWYNWWYWRPVSVPAANASELSVSYLTSFC